MLDVGRLHLLLAISEHGGTAGAARALGRPAEEVSGQVSDSERSLGLALLDGDQLTPAGRRLAEHGSRVLGQLEAAESDAAAVAGRLAGTLRLGVGAAAGRVLLADALPALRSAAPDLSVHVRQLAEERVGALGSTLDVVVVGEYGTAVPHRADAAVERRELLTEPLLLAVPSRHRATGASVRLAELAGESWIGGAGDALVALERAAAGAGFAPRLVAEVGEDALALTLVAAGQGVALVPASAAPAPVDGVRFLTVLDGGLRRTVVAAVRRSAVADPGVKRLLEALAAAARRVAAAVPGVSAAAVAPVASPPVALPPAGPGGASRRPDPLLDPLPEAPAPRNGRRDPWADRGRPDTNGTPFGTDLPGGDRPGRNGSARPSDLPAGSDRSGRNGSDPHGSPDLPGRNGFAGPPPAGPEGPGRNGFGAPADPLSAGPDQPSRNGFGGPAGGPEGPGRNGVGAPGAGREGPGRNSFGGPAGGPEGPGRNGFGAPGAGPEGPGRHGFGGPGAGPEGPGRNGFGAPADPLSVEPDLSGLSAFGGPAAAGPEGAGRDRADLPGLSAFGGPAPAGPEGPGRDRADLPGLSAFGGPAPAGPEGAGRDRADLPGRNGVGGPANRPDGDAPGRSGSGGTDRPSGGATRFGAPDAPERRRRRAAEPEPDGGFESLPAPGEPSGRPGFGGPADRPGGDLPSRSGHDLSNRGGASAFAPGALPAPGGDQPARGASDFGSIPPAGGDRPRGGDHPAVGDRPRGGDQPAGGELPGRPAAAPPRGAPVDGNGRGATRFEPSDGPALPPPGLPAPGLPAPGAGLTSRGGSSPYRTPPPTGDLPPAEMPRLGNELGPNPYRPDPSAHPAPDPFRAGGPDLGPNPYRSNGSRRGESLGGVELFSASPRAAADGPPAPRAGSVPSQPRRSRAAARGGDGSEGTLPPAPAGTPDVRLSIFEDLQSEWFVQRDSQDTAAPKNGSWQMAADDGWAAAARLSEPTTAGTTTAGLPRRRPQAMAMPGAVGGPTGGEGPPPSTTHRSPQEVRGRLSSYRDGVRRGRHAERTDAEDQ